MKTYWSKLEPLFQCETISKRLTRDRFYALRRTLHITDPSTYTIVDPAHPEYDKMRQTRWLLDHMNEVCEAGWKLGEYVTVDETMVWYKGKFCPARQYMPKKPEKWGLKFWCLADSASKYVYRFEVYCGRSYRTIDDNRRHARGEANLAKKVVMDLVESIHDMGHVIVMDNFFSSIDLFKALQERGTYATGTIRSNRIGLPLCLKNTKAFNRNPQGTLDWRMHSSRKIACAIWKDKKSVLLISTHAKPLALPCEVIPKVPRRNGADRPLISTSPAHLEYTTKMRGVDVADHLRSSYTSLTRSHKWWHRVFNYVLDLSVTNMYLMYLDILRQIHGENWRQEFNPLTRLEFNLALCNAMVKNWRGGPHRPHPAPIFQGEPRIHVPRWIEARRQCVHCNERRSRWYCPMCEGKHLCLRNGCFEAYHAPRR
jgi:hypothetical protein